MFNWKAAVCRAAWAVTGISSPNSRRWEPLACAMDITLGRDEAFWATPWGKTNPATAGTGAFPTSCPRTFIWRGKTTRKAVQQSGSYPCALLSVGAWKSWEADRALGGKKIETKWFRTPRGAALPGITPSEHPRISKPFFNLPLIKPNPKTDPK